ncbi:MAG: lysylphosphatidylglycerol synthase transmembrane domain-containing protein [Bradymonadia bacterium]
MKLKVLKWGLNGFIIASLMYWAQTQRAHDVFLKLASIPLAYLAAMMGLSLGLMFISALRWAHLIRAFGNPPPRVWHLFRLSLVGHFFNTFVPGAVGGDVLRATMTRGIYRQQNTSFLVVFCERAFGLVCLCLLLAVGTIGGPAQDLPHGVILGGAGLVASIILGALIRWRERIQNITRGYLDEIQQTKSIYWALGISFIGQLTTLCLFMIILAAFKVHLAITTVLFIVPLGLLASVIPLTILGAGAREVALISLLIQYGMLNESTAVGVSTAYLGCLWFLGLVGGAFNLLTESKQFGVKTTTDVDTIQLSDSAPPQD